MPFYNHITLIGYVLKVPEIRYTPNGKAVCDVRLLVQNGYKGKDSQKTDSPLFIACTMWGKMAETASQYLNKGRYILVEGKLIQDIWTDKDGYKKSNFKVRVNTFQFIPSKNDNKPTETIEQTTDSEDIPF